MAYKSIKKSSNFLYLLIIFFIFTACQEEQFSDAPVNPNACPEIVISETAYNGAKTDPHTILEAHISGDTLALTVQYGGGCGTINTDLVTTNFFMESDPVQLHMKLSFQDNDYCTALIQEQLCFLLSDLADIYNDSYQSAGGTIIIRLEGYEDGLVYTF